MIIWVLVIISAIWVYYDAKKLGIKKERDNKSFMNIGPIGWAFVTLGLWIIDFPLYLLKRREFKKKKQNFV